jgi:hypothetical protein
MALSGFVDFFQKGKVRNRKSRIISAVRYLVLTFPDISTQEKVRAWHHALLAAQARAGVAQLRNQPEVCSATSARGGLQ